MIARLGIRSTELEVLLYATIIQHAWPDVSSYDLSKRRGIGLFASVWEKCGTVFFVYYTQIFRWGFW
jgi:hypothetical protein